MPKTISFDEAQDLMYEDPVAVYLLEQMRWGILKRYIVRLDDKLWAFNITVPATEGQMWDEQDVTLVEVQPVEKTITVYEPL